MGAFIFDSAKGRWAEFHKRVNTNDPANAAWKVILLKTVEADATLKGRNTLAAILAAGGGTANVECDFTNYARKTIDDSGVGDTTVDTGAHTQNAAITADQTWTAAGGTLDNTIQKLLICFDYDTTSGTDADIVPVAAMDWSLTTNGNDITSQWNADGFASAGD